MKVLQINTTVNSGSTGRIAEDIGKLMIKNGHHSYMAAAYTDMPSESVIIPVGTKIDRTLHGLKTRLLDRHGFGSRGSTKHLIKEMDKINPSIVHLHNIHGYYLHIGVLFNYLKHKKLPIIWTFHDCWPFTGHCSYFDAVNCFKWETECHQCPNKKAYPASWFLDNSIKNFNDKRRIFNGLENLTIVTPSKWLHDHVKNSFLSTYPVQCINNGVDLEIFIPKESVEIRKKYHIPEKKLVLGVANKWDTRKGFHDFIQLGEGLDESHQIVLVGLNPEQIKSLPGNITGIPRTEDVHDLASLYSAASVFVNPTYVDNFPTTNLESLACGTPVITYDSGGSTEAIDNQTGDSIKKGDNRGLIKAVNNILGNNKEHYQHSCRKRAVNLYNKHERYSQYYDLYDSMLNKDH